MRLNIGQRKLGKIREPLGDIVQSGHYRPAIFLIESCPAEQEGDAFSLGIAPSPNYGRSYSIAEYAISSTD